MTEKQEHTGSVRLPDAETEGGAALAEHATNSERSDIRKGSDDGSKDLNEVNGNGTSSSGSDGSGNANPPAPQEKQRSTLQIAVVMSALGMAVFLAALDVTIITTALPTIAEHFGSAAGYTWIGSAYLLANSASTVTWGKVSDVFGRKPVLLLANFVFLIGSLVAALSNSIGMLIAARAVQGAGGGGLITLVNICISDLFSMRNRGLYFGIVGMVWAFAGAVGPLIGGAFTEKVTWRWCFYINLPLDGAAFLIILLFLDLKTPRTPFLAGMKSLDWIGSLTIIGGTLMFLLGLDYGGVTHPWNSAIVVCLLVFGVVTWILFALNEWKFAKFPVMPLRLFQYRSNLASLGVCYFHGLVFIASSYYLPLYFQAVRGATPILSGVYSLALAMSLSIVSAGTGIFIRKTGKYLPAIWFGMVFLTLGHGLLIDLDATSNWAKVFLYQIIAGIGVGPNFQAPLIALQTLVKPTDIATATATFQFTRQLATSMSVVIGQVVFQNQMAKKAPQLAAALGPQTAQQLGGGNAGANVGVVNALPPAQRTIARAAFADSLQPMWIMYTCFAAAGLVVSLLIGNQILSREHAENNTGLEAQDAARKERQEEDEARRQHKREGRGSRPQTAEEGDIEKGEKNEVNGEAIRADDAERH